MNKELEKILNKKQEKNFIEQWNNFRKNNKQILIIENIDFSRLDLFKINFNSCKLINCKFNYSNLKYSNFKKSSLIYCSVSYSNLQYSIFDLSSIDRCSFKDTNMSASFFNKTETTLTEFSVCCMNSIKITNSLFTRSDIRYCNIPFSNIDTWTIIDCDLSHTKIFDSILNKISFMGTSLGSVDLSNSILSNINFNKCNISRVNFNHCKSDKSYLSVTGIGSCNRQTIYCPQDDKIYCGCFIGSLKEFEIKVHSEYENKKSIQFRQYNEAIKYFKKVGKICLKP